jgi:hypothetical protein
MIILSVLAVLKLTAHFFKIEQVVDLQFVGFSDGKEHLTV